MAPHPDNSRERTGVSADASSDDRPKPFVEHLEDLRRAVIVAVAAIGLGFLVATPLAPWLLDALKLPVAAAGRDPQAYLRILKVAGGLTLAVKLIFWSGLLLGAPFAIWALGGFVFPGLTRREKEAVRRGSGAAVGLFFGRVALCYSLNLPVALRMMFAIRSGTST